MPAASDAVETAGRIARDVDAIRPAYTAGIREIRRRWSQTLRPLPAASVLAIARALHFPSRLRWVRYELIGNHRGAFAALTDDDVDAMARNDMDSWYAVDAFGTILVGRTWLRGALEDATVHRWAHADDRWLRRLALVATVGLNARGAGGPGDPSRTLAVCQLLVNDRDDMVVKALSWALRVLSERHRAAVESFVTSNAERLAARVRREVHVKLTTGVKNAWRLRRTTE